MLQKVETNVTLTNLQVSVAREHEETESLYPAAISRAGATATKRTSNAFGAALTAEKVHHRLFTQALEPLEQGRDIEGVRYLTCTRCGYTHPGEKPPVLCPACGTDRFKFTQVE